MRLSILPFLTASGFASVLFAASVAHAHVSLTSGPAATGKSQKITFGV